MVGQRGGLGIKTYFSAFCAGVRGGLPQNAVFPTTILHLKRIIPNRTITGDKKEGQISVIYHEPKEMTNRS